MKILSILPLTDNFTISKAGAASLFINELDSKNKNVFVAGSTDQKDLMLKKNRYINFNNLSRFPRGKNFSYASKIIKYIKVVNYDLIEIHNRPQIAIELIKKVKNIKINLYFHNDPNTLRCSNNAQDKTFLLKNCNKILFLSKWIKDNFFKDINYYNSEKCDIFYPNIKIRKNKKIKKENIIFFAGKLNSSKGYDLFCNTAKIFLQKYKNWKFVVAGNEPRESIDFSHPKFIKLGWLSYNHIKKYFLKSYITIVPSKWEEPLGRVAIEANLSDSIPIVSNKGGLLETSSNLVVLKDHTEKSLLNILEFLTKNQNKIKNMYFLKKNNNFREDSKKLYQKKFINKKIYLNKNYPIKILHIADLHLRHNGRLYYSTIKKLNNGFIRNGYNLQNFSDRDMKSHYRSFKDLNYKKKFDNYIKEYVSNFRPDIIFFGHADDIAIDTLSFIKKIYPGVFLSQWFLDPLISTGPDYKKNFNRFKSKLEICHTNFVTTNPKAIKLNNENIFYLPNPVDESIDILKVYENKNFLYDVFLAISHGQHRAVLKNNKIDSRLFDVNNLLSSPFIKTNFFGFKKQPIWGDRFFYELSLSSMGINLSRGIPIKHYSSDRIASLMGNGLLTFVNKKYKFSDFFSKNELEEFSNEEELIDKIIYYKSNPTQRKQIARNGRSKYFKLFNSNEICKYMVNKTLGITYRSKWEKK